MTSPKHCCTVMLQNITYEMHLEKILNDVFKELLWLAIQMLEKRTLWVVSTLYIPTTLNVFECFFLRLLLHTVRGPTSLVALRTVNDGICATFREACQLHGLLEDDQQ
jgi:hypothetical protein